MRDLRSGLAYKAHRDEFFVDLITGMSNAAIVVEDSWIQRAKPAVIHDVSTRVLAAEELICSKLFVTRRERFDGADIAHVIFGTQGKVDWRRVLDIIGENWEMLFWALVLSGTRIRRRHILFPRNVAEAYRSF